MCPHGVERHECLVGDVVCLSQVTVAPVVCAGRVMYLPVCLSSVFPTHLPLLHTSFSPNHREPCFKVHHQDSLATVLARNDRWSYVRVLTSLLPRLFSTTICYLDNHWTQSCTGPFSFGLLWPGLLWPTIPRGMRLPIVEDMIVWILTE